VERVIGSEVDVADPRLIDRQRRSAALCEVIEAQ
jgi:hypothetical protein